MSGETFDFDIRAFNTWIDEYQEPFENYDRRLEHGGKNVDGI